LLGGEQYGFLPQRNFDTKQRNMIHIIYHQLRCKNDKDLLFAKEYSLAYTTFCRPDNYRGLMSPYLTLRQIKDETDLSRLAGMHLYKAK